MKSMISLCSAIDAILLAIVPLNIAQAQSQETVFKEGQVPTEVVTGRALLWFRLAKHSDHGWKTETNIGLGALIGRVSTERSDNKVPLKKPIWPTVQIAPFDVGGNEFAGKGGTSKKNARKQNRPFYMPVKRFVFEDEDYRHYLVSIRRGNYVIGGTETTCFCWGSKWFAAPAGAILNMGTYYIATENGLSYWPDLATLTTSMDIQQQGWATDVMRLSPPTDTDKVPDAIAHLNFQPVKYKEANFFGNHYGRLVSRILPDNWKPGDRTNFLSKQAIASDEQSQSPSSASDAE